MTRVDVGWLIGFAIGGFLGYSWLKWAFGASDRAAALAICMGLAAILIGFFIGVVRRNTIQRRAEHPPVAKQPIPAGRVALAVLGLVCGALAQWAGFVAMDASKPLGFGGILLGFALAVGSIVWLARGRRMDRSGADGS